MQYFGGKHRIAKKLVQVMRASIIKAPAYAEPFVGGASVMCQVDAKVRIASDANEALITMFKRLSDGWEPPEMVSEKDYRRVKDAADPQDPLTAFVGFGLSFSGKWFGGYARNNRGRNYAKYAASSLRKKMAALQGVEWVHSDYKEMFYPPGTVIYCDPPYAGTTQYKAVGSFDWGVFWEWAAQKHREGCFVFVSEYGAPDGFKEIFACDTRTAIRTTTGCAARVERLFVPVDSDYPM